MTTSQTIGGQHWSHILRHLAPGPVAIGMRACVYPTVWLFMWTRRNAAQAPAEKMPWLGGRDAPHRRSMREAGAMTNQMLRDLHRHSYQQTRLEVR